MRELVQDLVCRRNTSAQKTPDPDMLSLRAVNERRVQEYLERLVRESFQLGNDFELSRETRFIEDLEADSLDSMDILMSIEEEYEVDLGESVSLQDLKTLGAAADLLFSKLSFIQRLP